MFNFWTEYMDRMCKFKFYSSFKNIEMWSSLTFNDKIFIYIFIYPASLCSLPISVVIFSKNNFLLNIMSYSKIANK